MTKIEFSKTRRFTCAEHGIDDKLPCPWPGCENGCADDDVELVFSSPDHADMSVHWRRHAWRDSTEETYYSWRSNDESFNKLTASGTVWSEYRRRKKSSKDQLPELLYHYTSQEGLIGIVQTNCLWLTDFSYLNDPKELMHGSDLIVRAIQELMPHVSCATSTDILESWQENVLDWKELRDSSPIRVCLASFSRLGDDLSQWRAYGKISIGFCPRELASHATGAILNEVIYSDEEQLWLAKLYLSHILSSLLEDLKRSATPGVLSSMYKDVEMLVELMAYVKDPSYMAEQEVRLMYTENTSMAAGFNPYGKKSKKFRVAGQRIVPYMVSTELADSDAEKKLIKSAIKEVVIGPGADPLVCRGVRELLGEHGMSHVLVRDSTIPYRN
jgi:hypothetical protein